MLCTQVYFTGIQVFINSFMADTPITLPDSGLFETFSHTLYNWVGDFILDPLKAESLVGFELTSEPVSPSEGIVTLSPKSNTVKSNSDYDGTDDTTTIVFKGVYLDQAAFESVNTLENGLTYYDETLQDGKVYYDSVYYTIDYSNIQYGGTFAGEFGAGLFPNTSVKWKDIIANDINEKQGWPPPADDPMSRFLFSIKIDPTPEKTRSAVIKYHVKTVTTTEGDPAAIPPTPDTYANTFRTETYTYNKVINNTLPDMIGAALETYYDGLPEMDYTTGEIIGE